MDTKQKELKHTKNKDSQEKSDGQVIHAFSVRGPLPPPNWLKQYDEIQPGLAERIVSLAEKQSKHRQHIEKRVVHEEIRSRKTGQWLAFFIAIFLIISSLFAAKTGAETLACIMAGATITGLVAAFLGVNFIKNKEVKKKATPV